jgi:HSP20 family molecular chaperone IbpA
MENNEKIKVESAGIDKDVLDIMTQEDVLKAISDETQMKRFELNFFCEFLSEIKGLRKDFDEFSQMISVCSAEKLADFFKELQGNVAQEQKRVELQEKMSQSHKKSKKVNTKSSQNSKKLSKGVK